MRRATREDAERWGTSSGYYGETPASSGAARFAHHPVPLGGRDEQYARREAPRVLGQGRRAVLAESGDASSLGIVRTADTVAVRGRAPKAKAGAVARNGLALGAHNPKVRRAPRRAHATMRARKLHPRLGPRRGASRRPLPPGAFGQKGG